KGRSFHGAIEVDHFANHVFIETLTAHTNDINSAKLYAVAVSSTKNWNIAINRCGSTNISATTNRNKLTDLATTTDDDTIADFDVASKVCGVGDYAIATELHI